LSRKKKKKEKKKRGGERGGAGLRLDLPHQRRPLFEELANGAKGKKKKGRKRREREAGVTKR